MRIRRPVYIVRRLGGAWVVRRRSDDRLMRSFPTRVQAVAHAAHLNRSTVRR